MAKTCMKKILISPDGHKWHLTPRGYLRIPTKMVDIHIHGMCMNEQITDGAQRFRVTKNSTLKQIATHVVKNSYITKKRRKELRINSNKAVAREAAQIGAELFALPHNTRILSIMKKFGFVFGESVLFMWFPRGR